MTREVTIKLINQISQADEYGIMQPAGEEAREVMARIESVSASEYFEAGRLGFRPEYRFKMFLYDYDDQKEVEYDGVRYTVYRKFMGRSDTVELYVTLKGATNNG